MRITHRLVAAVAASAMLLAPAVPARAQVIGPLPVIDAAANANLLAQYARMFAQLQEAIQIFQVTQAAYNQATQQFQGITQGRWLTLEQRFAQVLAVPSFLQQTAAQSTANLNAFEARFPNYVPNANYANYEAVLANNTKSAAQSTLLQAGTFNTNFQGTETYTHNLLNQPPATQEQAIHTMSILLQQDIEQLGKMGNLLSAQSSNMAMYQAMEENHRVMNRTLDCQSQIKTVLNSARQLDAAITYAQVHDAVMANSPNCASEPNAL